VRSEATVVVDIGKTNAKAKASLWQANGALTGQHSRPNARVDVPGYLALGVDGIETWLIGCCANLRGTRTSSALFQWHRG